MEHTVISVSGADRISFLQGQLTQDIAQITPETGLQAAWCNPKGRVLVTCRVFAAADQHFLVLPTSSAEAVLSKLLMYRLRAKVELEFTNLYQLVSVPAEQALSALDNVARLSLPFVTDTVELFSTPSALDRIRCRPSVDSVKRRLGNGTLCRGVSRHRCKQR